MHHRPHLIPLLVVTAFLGMSCRETPRSESGATRHPIKGRVVAVDVEKREITLDHEEIPGFMPAMTMPFVVLEKDTALLKIVAPGDEVTAVLVVPDSRYWIEDLVVVKRGTPDPKATRRSEARMPRAGDAIPDVALVNQDGETIRLSDYRGRVLALTFIFTRCPLPDFCPLMMKNFQAVHAALVAEEPLRARTHLLAVSFDTAHDTPEVLRAYGKAFQKTDPPFTHWELATGSDEAVRTLGAALGLDYVEEDGSFTHNLRTVVVDREGKVFRFHRGNDWTPQELLAELRSAAEP